MEIKCKKTPTTGVQIFIDDEFLTSFSYSPESDEIIELIESVSKNKIKIKQLESRIKELENTIENMKAIAGEKIKQVGSITSVDYPSDNETELITEMDGVCGVVLYEITKTKCCGIAPIINENYCPNCGRKIIR